MRYEALSALAKLLTVLAPKAQYKFHAELVPVLTRLMCDETSNKMKTKAGDALSSFFEGLLADEEEEDSKVSGKDLVLQYAEKTLEVSKSLLKKGIEDDYEPL